MAAPFGLMTYEDLIREKIISFPVATFYRLRKRDHRFPRGLKIGRSKYYNPERIAEWAAEVEDEIEQQAQDAAWEAERLSREAAREAERLAREVRYRENAILVYRRILAWLDSHPGVAERLEPWEYFFPRGRVFDTLPEEGLEMWEPSVQGTASFAGVARTYWPTVETILARPLPDPPRPFDRTFGGVLDPD